MAEHRTTHYQFNWPLLGGTFILGLLLGGGAYFWHARQIDQIAQAMLERADDLEKNKKYEEAAQYLFQYVGLQPEDSAGRVRLAAAYDHLR